MKKTTDLTKHTAIKFNTASFRKAAAKFDEGFYDVDTWISTGNHAINKIISNSYFKGIPLGKVTIFSGASGSGKSLFCSGEIVKQAQQNDILPIILDSEYAIDKSWIEKIGVDLDPDKIMRFPVDTVESCAKLIQTFMDDYKKQYEDEPKENRPKVLFIIDSLGQLSTGNSIEQFSSGTLKGDMGIKSKQLKALIQNANRMFGAENGIGLLCTNHVYSSQDQFHPDPVQSGGSGPIFSASIVVVLDKLKLKEDDDGNKTKTVQGIRSKVQCVKSRFTKPFENIEIKIPYDQGIDPYSGLVELLERLGVLTKDGNKLKYIDKAGNIHKYFRGSFPEEILMQIMQETDNDITLPPSEGDNIVEE